MAAAAWHDLHRDKIPNHLILCGMVLGIILRIAKDILLKDLWDIPTLVLEFLSLFFCLWPVYQTGGLGAGDCKLLLVAGIFLPVKQALFVIIVSFIIAAAGGILQLAIKKALKKKVVTGKIHFSVPLLLAMLLYLGIQASGGKLMF